jgi:hypothetical protein
VEEPWAEAAVRQLAETDSNVVKQEPMLTSKMKKTVQG